MILMTNPIDEAIEQVNKNNEPTQIPLAGKRQLMMIFHSNGNIEFNAEGVGMMDLWAGSHFLRVQGDQLYVNQMRDIATKAMNDDPTKRIVVAREIPEAKAGN